MATDETADTAIQQKRKQPSSPGLREEVSKRARGSAAAREVSEDGEDAEMR